MVNGMALSLIRCDITTLQVDAIVNAANSALAPGGGVCGAIFKAAGYHELDAACKAIGGCSTGQAVITGGFALPAKYVVHTVGPIWHGGDQNEARLLHDCYLNSLKLAAAHGCRSIAFPLISSGIYGYPKKEAFKIAIAAIEEFLKDEDMEVILALFDAETVKLGQALLERS
jgi:O-acetyl-ADP-ribose deacetylase (regulator of RNase III)